MSDDLNNQVTNHDGFEREDLSARSVMYFMAGLTIFAAVIYVIVFGMYRFLDTYEKANQPAISPLVTPQADTRTMTEENTKSFPQPRLEENERNQLRSVIQDQDRKIETYDWVDKDKGIVKIPIERAMDLLVQRGLPVRPENAGQASETRQPKTKRPATTPATATDGN
jgi:hypothetical protein